jgi:hypothetical protein
MWQFNLVEGTTLPTLLPSRVEFNIRILNLGNRCTFAVHRATFLFSRPTTIRSHDLTLAGTQIENQ